MNYTSPLKCGSVKYKELYNTRILAKLNIFNQGRYFDYEVQVSKFPLHLMNHLKLVLVLYMQNNC